MSPCQGTITTNYSTSSSHDVRIPGKMKNQEISRYNVPVEDSSRIDETQDIY